MRVIEHQPLILTAHASLQKAIVLMSQSHHQYVLVVESEANPVLVGILTEKQALRWLADGNSSSIPLEQAMSLVSLTIQDSEQLSLRSILDLFQCHCLEILPVVNAQAHPIGVITPDSLLLYISALDCNLEAAATEHHSLQVAQKQQQEVLQQKVQLLKREVKKLKRVEQELEMFFSQSLDGFFFMMLDKPIYWDDTVDKEQALDYVFAHQRITKINDAMLKQYGTTLRQFLGLTPNDLFAHNLSYGRTIWRQFFDEGRLHIETQERKVDGTPIQIEGDYICLYDGKGRIVGHFGIQRDVSERQKVQEALKRREQYLEVLVEIQRQLLASSNSSGYPLILQKLGQISGADRVYLFQNCQNETGQLLMTQQAEWCVEGVRSDISSLDNLPYEDFCPRWAATLSQGEIINGVVADFPETERAILEPQGILSILLFPIFVNSEFCGFIGFDNCTSAQPWSPLEVTLLGATASAISFHQESLRAEEALRSSKEAAESANQAKSEFLANISHELRTPLNAILGFTQVMQRDTQLKPEHQEYIGIINRSGQHLLRLINDVLEMSKIEAGRVKLNPVGFDLYHVLDTLYEMLHLKAKAKNVQLILDRSPTLPQYITTDESKLRQVLLNLLGNAIKFTHQGHVILRVREQPCESIRSVNDNQEDTTSRPYSICFEVEDTGVGISPEELPRLFTSFVQTHSGQQSSEGTGLGLAISQKFIQLMGGNITVTSEVDRGSIFQFNILAFPTWNSQAVQVEKIQIAQRVIGLAPNQPQYRLLVVEDRWENQQLLIELLQPIGFAIQVAANGQQGIALWESWQPDLILMDMRMPVMDGYEATRQIKATPQGESTIIIAVTSSAFQEDRDAILGTGCNDFISKPFKEETIFAKLTEHLGVQFLYEEQTEANSDLVSAVNPSLIGQELRLMPYEWLAQLHEAAIQGRERQILALIQNIPPAQASLAKALEKLTHDFRFGEIADLSLP